MKILLTLEQIALEPQKYKLTGAGQKALSRGILRIFQSNSDLKTPLDKKAISDIKDNLGITDVNSNDVSKYFAKK